MPGEWIIASATFPLSSRLNSSLMPVSVLTVKVVPQFRDQLKCRPAWKRQHQGMVAVQFDRDGNRVSRDFVLAGKRGHEAAVAKMFVGQERERGILVAEENRQAHDFPWHPSDRRTGLAVARWAASGLHGTYARLRAQSGKR
jgi:hypothetical protein